MVDTRNVIIEYPVTGHGYVAGARYAVKDAATAAAEHPYAVIIGYEGESNLRVNQVTADYLNDKFEALEALQDSNGKFTRAALADDVAAGISVNVLEYGAKGDGVTDDWQAITNAVAAAGEYGTVGFPPGRTYRSKRTLTALNQQVWMGYGATIKRADVITAKTTAIVAAGAAPHSVPVDDASRFEVGMQVSITDGSQLESTYHYITAISGNTLTLQTSLLLSFAAGSTVYTSFPLVYSPWQPKATFLGLTLDGNRANNQVGKRWETNSTLRASGRQVVIRDCYVINSQADGILADGENTTIENNYVQDSEGNGIHVGLSTHLRIVGNYVVNANLGGDSVGHADGGIIASNDVRYAYVAGNYVENAKAGIGAWDSDDNSDLICVGNTIRNCTLYAIDLLLPLGAGCGRVIISNNAIYNSVSLKIRQVSNSTPRDVGPFRVLISGNYVENTPFDISNAFDILVSSNISYISNTTDGHFNVVNGANIIIRGNDLRGGARAVYQSGTTNTVIVESNTCTDQTGYGINYDGAPIGGSRITNNVVIASATAATTWSGITGKDGVLIDGNRVECSVSHANITGLRGSAGSGTTNGCFMLNNIVRQPAGVSVRLAAGSQKNVVKGNLLQAAIADGGTPNNTVADNITIL